VRPYLERFEESMPNIATVLKEEIRRLARREIRSQIATTKRASAQYRRQIAALKQQIGELARQVKATVRRSAGATAAPAAEPQVRLRFVAKGLRSHRQRMGLSQAAFAKLAGVSAQSVYNWERGTSTPRGAQLAKLATLRALGKREAAKRLEQVEAPARTAKRAKKSKK
jgi:DNA-binding transcriptional regulator YiaG